MWKRASDLKKVISKSSGGTFRFRCAAIGSPEPNVTFTKNSETITDTRVNRAQWYILIENLQPSDAGYYTCNVCNVVGCISHSTKLEVQDRFSRNLKSFPADLKAENLQMADAPTDDHENTGTEESDTYGIERTGPHAPYWKKDKEMNQIVAKPSGNMARLRCLAGGLPEPSLVWKRNNESKPIERTVDRVKYARWGITLENLVPADSGNYTCTACNEMGCIEHTTKLMVQGKSIENLKMICIHFRTHR